MALKTDYELVEYFFTIIDTKQRERSLTGIGYVTTVLPERRDDTKRTVNLWSGEFETEMHGLLY